MKKENKKEIGKKIKEFFKNKHSGKEVKKIRKLAMHNNIKLREFRKKFCKKCFSMNLRVRSVKKDFKNVECRDCGNLMRWKMKS